MLKVYSTAASSGIRLSWCRSSHIARSYHLYGNCARATLSKSASSPAATEINNALPSSTLASLPQLQQQIGELSQDRTVSPAPPLTFVVSGPSGVGKDAVIKQLQQTRPELHFVVTATSRSMRPEEVDGIDYIFVTKEKFESWIKADQLLEHALVYGGCNYAQTHA
ncbi:TPA: hypothetical protein ACH3X1_004976 [Trebouxia sp. C0004]